MTIEDRLAELGITLPDFSDGNYYGTTYGKMKTHHIVGNVLYLSGHTPVQNGQVLHPGRVGGEITPEQGYEAARLTGINMIAGMKHALGDLGRVKGLIRCLCFVACEPDFNDVHLVSSGCSDVLFDVFGDPAGIGGRATIGVQSLCDKMCFETWSEVEIA
ncbi:RidA family protein [Albibacillus kandeliae]|uniref:RidA family protein n=1 Tax=Albibacillus kandeliae TaxID=2174228 RepID=UPI0018E53DEB|nr:RidA family protein [Albibacillus kandeliae]